MRLWHYELVKNNLLPTSQLKGLWRELNSIFIDKPKHLLIDYIYEYDIKDLYNYSILVINQMKKLKKKDGKPYRIKLDNFNRFFNGVECEFVEKPFAKIHDTEYLVICFWNLREKYIRQQKDFTKEKWWELYNYCKDKIFFQQGGLNNEKN